ncbi:cytochrome P450 family protein [Rhizoctonia solani]|uniref:Cytochrome P450 family protein n=1 Tax=Rhizoctonia solani TaxID=456999 RepID=A0A8H8NYC0_9AGAM|nr:cytochrome P450 family protein [Rhizoctonia solani]QRW21138.1 cytochrome P450 family protein [Rhizoctonia solani]
MTPTVTTVFHTVAENLKDALIKDINGSETKEIDMLLWCSKAALDLVGRGVLGHQFGILKGIESEYSRAIKSCNPAITQAMPFLPIFSLVYRFVPTSLQRKLAEWVPIQLVRKLKNIVDIQDAQAKSILMQKRKALNEPGASNNARDIMSLLLKANSEADQRDQLPENQILGQMNTLMLAGHETTSTISGITTTFFEYTTSGTAKGGATKAPSILSYEELSSLPYLDAVSLKDWVVPLRYPLKGKDGNTITDIKVKKGTSIYVSFRGANRCKETWGEDADEFKPERWLKFLPNSVYEAKTSGIYSSIWAKVVHWLQVLSFRAHRSDLHPAQSELNGFRALQWFHTLKEQTTVSQMERSHVCR